MLVPRLATSLSRRASAATRQTRHCRISQSLHSRSSLWTPVHTSRAFSETSGQLTDNDSRQNAQPNTTNPLSDALKNASPKENDLLAPVHIPEDPHAIIKERHAAASVLANSAVVVQRKLELMNVLLNFEQANRYLILDAQGNHIGYAVEQDGGIGKTMARQMLRTHRAFTTRIFDKHERELLVFHRPFSWINSRIFVHDAASSVSASPEVERDPQTMPLIGEAQQQWAPMRRKYNLFLNRSPDPADIQMHQFAHIDSPFLSWDFDLLSQSGSILGSVNRNWRGFGRELFTDTGAYALRMDSAGMSAQMDELPAPGTLENPHKQSDSGSSSPQKPLSLQQHPEISGMTLDQRAVMLATAVTIDFDYFSRHSSHGGAGFMPLWIPMGGEAGGAAGAGAAGAEAGAVGAGAGAGEAGTVAAGEGIGAGAGILGRGAAGAAGEVGVGEGAMAGAGTIAGYEAMQQARQSGQHDDSGAASEDPFLDQQKNSTDGSGEDVWSSGRDPWDQGPPSGDGGAPTEGGDGEGVVESITDAISSFFGD